MRPFAALCCLLASLSFHPGATGELMPHTGIPDHAPPLDLLDLGGKPHNLDTYQGRVVLVNFWATWCAPCLIEMPSMQRLQQAMGDRPFSILAVNVKEPKAKVWRFKKLVAVKFTTLLDETGDVSQDWDVQVYPTSYLIDAEGRVRYVAYGALTWDDEETLRVIEELMPDRQRATQARSPNRIR